MQDPSADNYEQQYEPPSAMESSEKSPTHQELPPDQVPTQPIYPTSTTPGPPENLTQPPYPSTTMQGGPPPAAYHTPNPTNLVVTGQPYGTYPAYPSTFPTDMPPQPQPVYTMPVAPQPQLPPTNLPPYPTTTTPGAPLQYTNPPAYETQTNVGYQQPHVVFQNTSPSMGTTQHYPALVNSKPKDYLVWSILSMLCCFFPLGVAAVVFSCKTSDDVIKQDWNAAKRNSGMAFIFNLISLIVGIIFYIILISLQLA